MFPRSGPDPVMFFRPEWRAPYLAHSLSLSFHSSLGVPTSGRLEPAWNLLDALASDRVFCFLLGWAG